MASEKLKIIPVFKSIALILMMFLFSNCDKPLPKETLDKFNDCAKVFIACKENCPDPTNINWSQIEDCKQQFCPDHPENCAQMCYDQIFGDLNRKCLNKCDEELLACLFGEDWEDIIR